MRIGMILDTAFPPDSRVENEAVSLIHQGHEVFLFALNRGAEPKGEEYNGIQVRRFPTTNFEYKSSALAYTFPYYHWKLASKIDAFIREVNPDVLHVHDLTVARAGVAQAAKHTLPVVLDLHENRPVIMQEYVHLKKFPGKYLIDTRDWQKWQTRLANKADRLVLVTDEACADMAAEGIESSKMVSVPNTVTLDIYDNYALNPSIPERFQDHFVLLYMGDTGLRRGTDTLIEALPHLVKQIPNVKLVFVGSNTEDVHLRRMARDLGVKDLVEFEGWQDVSLFPSYVEAADLCFSPLKRNRHHDTTFANKIFQYMAGGKPLIVSDCPPQARVVLDEQCGKVHAAEDAKELATEVIALHANPGQMSEMGKNARKAVEDRWNWRVTSQALLDMYASLAESVQK